MIFHNITGFIVFFIKYLMFCSFTIIGYIQLHVTLEEKNKRPTLNSPFHIKKKAIQVWHNMSVSKLLHNSDFCVNFTPLRAINNVRVHLFSWCLWLSHHLFSWSLMCSRCTAVMLMSGRAGICSWIITQAFCLYSSPRPEWRRRKTGEHSKAIWSRVMQASALAATLQTTIIFGRYALDRNSLIRCSIYLHDALCGNG